MEISGNNINQPVSFYNKNTGNNINMAINEETVYGSNLFMPEFSSYKVSKPAGISQKRRKKGKRLNTIDSDYLPDEPSESVKAEQANGNFFLENNKQSLSARLKKAASQFFESAPLINYFFLKQKTKKIQQTVATLTDINRNMDDLLNTAVPYGEESALYTDIAKNLTNAAIILGKANKDI